MSEIDDLLAQLNGGSDAPASDSGQSSAGGKLRQQLEQVLAQNKQLQEQLAQTQAAERTRAVEGLFAKHQIPAKALDFFPKDAAPNDETATAFVEKYGDLWGASSATASTPPAQQAQTQAMQQFQQQAAPPAGAVLTEDDYRLKFAEANTQAELLAMLAELGSGIPD